MSDWLYKIASYASYLPIIVALYHHKYLSKSLWWYMFGLLAFNTCGIISIQLGENHINNHFMTYVSACSVLILRAVFFFTFLRSIFYKNIIIYSVIIYLLGVCVEIYLHGIYLNQYLAIVLDIWLAFFLLLCLNQILKDENIESLRDLPIFWILIGTLIFVLFDFFVSVTNGWLYAVNRSFLFILWDYIVPIFMFIRIAMVSIGYWKTKKYAENLIKT
jgi:hypothetical protein